ncbi:MAG: TldD/PmbA family protein [Candidatus Thorarchaeota archaeon]
MVGFDEMKTIIDTAIDYAEDKTEGIIVRGTIGKESQIRFSQNSIDISKRWQEMKLEMFIILKGAQSGFTERSVTSVAEAKQTVDDGIEFIKHLPESFFFAGVEETVSKYTPVPELVDPKFDDFTEKAPEYVNAAIEAAVEEGAIRVAGALAFGKRERYFRSSYGPSGESTSTVYDLNVRAFQDELDYSGQGLSCGTKPTSSEKQMIEAGAKAGRLSKQASTAVQGEPGKYDLVLSPTVAADVLGFVPGAANPFYVMIGISPLADRMGQSIAPEHVTVCDDPTMPEGLGSRSFDFEGTPSRKTTLVEEGVLKGFVHNTTTARMFETESTGSSGAASLSQSLKMLLPVSSNIVFNQGDHTLEELLENNRPTIYVTCNWYTRFQNYQTGEFSTIPRDAMFLIKDGEMKPIKNLRISDNVMRMFANIDAMGKDRTQVYWWEVATPTFIPSVRVKDCRMSAATQ